jgi:hypothetical protein
MFEDEIDYNQYDSPFDALNEDYYAISDSEENDSVVNCANCNWAWDISDSSPEDTYVCHKCGYDNSDEEEVSNFDDSVFNMDFSEIRGKDFKRSFGKVNRKIENNTKPKGSQNARLSTSNGRRAVNRSAKQPIGKNPTNYSSSRINAKDSFRHSSPSTPKSTKKPINNSIPVKDGKYKLRSGKQKKIAKVIVPNDQKVIIQGASKFILSQKPKDEGIKNIQWYRGEKLQPLVLIINNDTPVDFNFELFNPSMPLDYLYSTSQNLNDRITVAGGIVSYTDVLYNLLANPALIINAQLATAGSQVANQNNQSMFWKNKTIEGVQAIIPVNLDLQIDNMQVLNDIIYFNIQEAINRPFVPDGMDVIQYKVLAGMTVTMCFWYKQVSLKKFFYKEARESKSLM